jgi:hypothetical protein
MGIRVALLIAFTWATCAEAALTVVKREMFQGIGTLTSGSPGANFQSVSGSIYKRPGGPRLSTDTNGYSGDVSSYPAYGVFTAGAEASSKFALGGWFYFATLGANTASINYLMGVRSTLNDYDPCYLALHNGSLWAETALPTSYNFSLTGVAATNQWLYFFTTFSNISAQTWNVNFYYATNGGSLTYWCGFTNQLLWNDFGYYRFGQDTSAQPTRCRVGSAAVYSWTTTNDFVYPSDTIYPVSPMTWYLNPATGNDSNDGITASTAWASVGKLNTESSRMGLFPANSITNADLLYIDTFSAPLDLAGTAMTPATLCLNIRAPSTNAWINVKAHKTLVNANFSATSGTTKVYQTSDTTNNSVVWENSLWMSHPTGASFASVSNSLQTVAGSSGRTAQRCMSIHSGILTPEWTVKPTTAAMSTLELARSNSITTVTFKIFTAARPALLPRPTMTLDWVTSSGPEGGTPDNP